MGGEWHVANKLISTNNAYMKLTEIKQPADAPLTEDREYSDEFASIILNEQQSEFKEISADALLSKLDQMIAEALHEQEGADANGKAES